MVTGWKRSIAAVCVGDCEDYSAELERDEPQADVIYSSCDPEDGIVSHDIAGWYMGQRCTSVSVGVREVTAREYVKSEELFGHSAQLASVDSAT